MKPTLLIIFGFTGDLVNRYFLPALYHLKKMSDLPDDLTIIATTRRNTDRSAVKKDLIERLTQTGENVDERIVDSLINDIDIVNMRITDKGDYENLKQKIEAHDSKICKSRLFYFAVPPGLFETVLDNITANSLHRCGDGVTARLLIEKPFGNNTASAQALLDKINQNFGPEHLYPIDHYLAKETVQNILYFRFHNPLIRAIWSSKYIKQIQVSAIEDIDIQGRVNFYEQTGAVRDMVQSHLLQLAALAVMDEPDRLSAADIRQERQEALESFAKFSSEDVSQRAVRAQYEGYRKEVNNPHSVIETFVAIKLYSTSDRWKNIPIYIRAGKAMDKKVTEINLIYNDDSIEDCQDNILTLRIQPNEGVAVQLTAKKPGLKNETQKVTMDYCYKEDDSHLHDAYEKILYDAIAGDQTLFPTDKEIINNWQLVEPIIEQWHTGSQQPPTYQKGASDIESADNLLQVDGHSWISLPNICQPRR